MKVSREEFMVWLSLAVAGALLLAIALRSGVAMAWPENVRLGYSSCSTCHVSPSGGGTLTSYGRSLSDELSTFAQGGDGLLAGKLELPDYVAVGGDIRYLYLQQNATSLSLPMQRDFELGLHPAPYLWEVVSAGWYGAENAQEIRRNYLMWTPSDAISLRAGKFFPSYGLGLADHRASVRQGLGFDEGQETYNAEASYRSEYGEISAAPVFGTAFGMRATATDGYRWRAREAGGVARLSAYIGSRALAGASWSLRTSPEKDTESVGIHATIGFTRNIYLLAEADRRWDTEGVTRYLSYAEAGAEVWRGVHVQLLSDYDGAAHVVSPQVQLLPLAHFEILGRASYHVGERAWSYTALAHYYP